jgi:hypothetical protein
MKEKDMLQTPSSNATPTALRTGRFFGAQFIAFVFVFTSLPATTAVMASYPTPPAPEVASPQPQESPTATPTPTEEELKLQQEKKILELQRDIEQAKKAIRDAQPQPAAPTATPLSGDTTLTEVKLEPEIVSYKAMSEAAKIISSELQTSINSELTTIKQQLDVKINTETNAKTKKGLQEERSRMNFPNLAIYDAQVVKDWRFYQALFPAFDGEVKDLVNRYWTQLCPEKDLSPEFKQFFCDNNKALVLSEGLGVKEQLATDAIPAAFGAGTNLLKSFIDLAALFRTDTKIEGKPVTIEESAFVAELFRALKNDYDRNINLYYPEVFHPRVTPPAVGLDRDKYSTTVTTIGTLFLTKIEADKVIAARNKEKKQLQENDDFKQKSKERDKLAEEKEKVDGLILQLKNLRTAYDAEDDKVIKKRISSEIAELTAKLDRLEAPTVLQAKIDSLDKLMEKTKGQIKALTDQVKNLTDLNERFQSFVDQFVKVDNNGVNALALFIKSEDIENALPEGNSFWLEIKSVSAGGSNRTRKNLLRYFLGAKVDHSGGVIVEYTLYKRTGGVIYSDKLTRYEGYVEPKRMRDDRAKDEKFKDPVK